MRDMGPALDPEGEIVGVPWHHRYHWMDLALQRINPHIRLGFDRRFCFWVVVREDKETIRCGKLDGGAWLSWLRPHVTVLETWSTFEKRGNRKVRVYREPSVDLVLKIAQREAIQMERDQSRWVEKTLRTTGEKREAAFNQKSKKLADDVAAEWCESGGPVNRVQVGYEPR